MKQLTLCLFLFYCSYFGYSQDSLSIWEHVFVPNMFSPNDDGDNDEFKIYGKGFQSLELRVYDRWAELVYRSTDLEEITKVGWNGETGNKKQPAGSYLWVISGFFESGKKVIVEGKNSGTLILFK